MNKKYGPLVTLAVLLIFLINIDVGLINCALGDIAKSFPGVNGTLISMVATLPTLLMIPMTILSGKLCYYYSKKKLLIIGLVIYIIGGVGGAFISGSIYQVLSMRIILGIGAGIAAPLSAAIIAELYSNIQRAKMLGWSNAFNSVVAIAMTTLAGYLAVISWRYTFFAYAVFILILILELVALPDMVPEREQRVEMAVNEPKEKLGMPLFILAASVLFVLLNGIILMLKLSMFIENSHIGNALTVAGAFNFYSFSIFLVGMCFSQVYKFFKRYTVVVSLIFQALAFFIILNAKSAIVVDLGMSVNGIGGGMFIPFMMMRASMVSKTQKSFAIALVLQALFMGQFLGSFMETTLHAVFGNASIQFLYTYGGCVFVVYAVIAFVFVTLTKKAHNDIDIGAEV